MKLVTKIYHIFFLIFYFFTIAIFAVSELPKNSILLQDHDSISINNNYRKGLEFLSKNRLEESNAVILLGLKASIKLNDKNLIALGNFYLGEYFYKKQNYAEAILNYTNSLNIYTELNNEAEIANCYFNLGKMYQLSSEYDKALANFFKSLKSAETKNEAKKIADNLTRIGEVYLKTLDLDKAQDNFTKSLKINEELNDFQGIVINLSNLGASYQKQGNVLKAIELYKKALPIAKNNNFEIRESILLGNIGSSSRRIKEYDTSLEYLFKALSLKLKLKRYASAAHSCNDISETYIEIGNLSKAKEFALKAIEYAKENSIHQERYAYYVLSNIEYDLGNYKNSIKNLKQYHILQDSLFSIEKMASINEMQIKYETEKKNLKIVNQESNIALLDSRNKIKNQLLLFGGLSLLLVFISIILYKSNSAAKKEKLLQQQFSENLLKSQEEERTRIARELHDSVGQQLTLIKRQSQNKNQKDITELTNNALEEVRSISRGLYPALLKQLGLTESIEQLINDYDEQTELFFSIDIDNVNRYFTESSSLNFYRLIQECLTNIVKHAKAKSVTISIKKERSTIITLISDNGKGFNVNDNKKKNSLGLKTIFERIRIMNGNLSIDSKLNNGTSFIFSIPVKNE